MATSPLKKVGDDIRARLQEAQSAGYLPSRQAGDGEWVRYDVRASNSKAGPKVNITINGYEWLILAYAQRWAGLAAKGDSFTTPQTLSDVAKDVFTQWEQTEGKELVAKVDEVAARHRWASEDGSIKVSGSTKFGVCIVSVTAARVSREGSRISEADHYDPRLYCGKCRVEILRGEDRHQLAGPDGIQEFCGTCNTDVMTAELATERERSARLF